MYQKSLKTSALEVGIRHYTISCLSGGTSNWLTTKRNDSITIAPFDALGHKTDLIFLCIFTGLNITFEG